MTLRLIEIFLSLDKKDKLIEIVKGFEKAEVLHMVATNGKINIKILVPAEESEILLDALSDSFSHLDTFRMLLLSMEAAVPSEIDRGETFGFEKSQVNTEQKTRKPILPRVSRQELYADVLEAGKLSHTFLLMLILSSIVGAVGLIQSSTAIVIGAMVIAPLLGPNVAMALASTLGDFRLASQAKKACMLGILIPVILSALAGYIFKIDPTIEEIASRTTVSFADIVLALAAGCAGTLSFTMATSGALIGVMVAVALLPPLVTFGLLLGSGHFAPAMGALLLAVTNMICINLAGVITFLFHGVRPLNWWEQNIAKKASRRALITWIIMLALLLVLIMVAFKPA